MEHTGTSASAHTSVSAVILTWNSGRHIERCIASLVQSASHAQVPLDIFIFDNGSTDGTLAALAKLEAQYPNLSVERSEKNTGTTYPRNVGIRRALARGATHILILDSDTEVRTEALAQMLACGHTHPEAGMVVPTLRYPDGTVQESYRRFPTATTKFLRVLVAVMGIGRRVLEKDESYSAGDAHESFYPDYAISACWLVRREAFEQVGVFDEKIFYSPEDVDFCIRLMQRGFRIALCPSAEVVHHCQRESYKKIGIGMSHLKGLAYLFLKHRYFFSRKGLHK